MLSQSNRLRKKKDFDLVFKNGKSFYLVGLGVKINPNHLPHNRYGIIISTKVSKKAVERNKLKRQIRSVIKEWENNLAFSYDIVIIVQPPLLKKNYKEIKKILEKCFLKLRLFS